MKAIKAGLLIDGKGGKPTGNAVVLVDDRKIIEVGSASKVTIPHNAEILDCADKTVMPGMIDCHDHVSLTTVSIEKLLYVTKTVKTFETAAILKRTLHSGFTTVRDAGTLNDVGFRQAVEMGLIEGPRLVLAGAIAQTGGHFDFHYPSGIELERGGSFSTYLEIADGVPAVRAAVRRVLREGFDFIKVCSSGGFVSPSDSPEYTEWTLDELKVMVYEASARGKAVMAHACGTQGIKNAILAGVWSVEHGDILDDEAIRMFLDTGTFLVTSLFATDEMIHRGREIGLDDVMMAKVQKYGEESVVKSFRKAAAAGVRIAMGSDAIDDKMHGRNARELELMARYGFTSMQAIVAATKTAAEACRVSDRVGTLEAGKLADLLVVDGNPLDDITILQDQTRLKLVMKEGKTYVNHMQ